MIGVYEIYLTDGGASYIGSSKNIAGRRKKHLTALRSGRHHCKLLQGYYNVGYGFKFRVLHEISVATYEHDPRTLTRLEQHYIDRSEAPLLNSSFNARNCMLDPVVRAKVAKAHIGMKASPETCEKISAGHLNRTEYSHGKKHGDAIRRYIAEHPGYTEARIAKIVAAWNPAKRKAHGQKRLGNKYAAILSGSEARAIFHDPRSQRMIARAYGISRGTVGKIKRRQTWTNVTNRS